MKVTMIMTVTADGFITRDATQDAGWVTEYDKLFFDEKTRAIGTVILGANSFRLLSEPFEGRLTIVMTSTPDVNKNVPNSIEFHSEEPKELLKLLEERDIHEVALVGGAQLNASFLNEQLVDEIYLLIVPELFGEGVSLTSGYQFETKLRLLDVQQIESAALIHYAVERS